MERTMAKIIFLKGLPASGKTTWSKNKLEEGNYLWVNKDTIREMLGPFSKKREKDTIRIRNELIRLGLKMGKNIIVDDTNLNPVHERSVKQIAKENNADFEINDSFMAVSPEECIKRDLERQKSVGASVIWEMFEKWMCPDKIQKLDDEWDKRRCVIFDIDGTLAHNKEGRNIYDYSRVQEDTPDPLLSLIADSLNENVGKDYLDIVIVTGRNEDSRQATEDWLDNNMIPFKTLYMRPDGDKRPDEVLKKEIYENLIQPNWCVLGVFEDRPKVARMWRKEGLNVAQVGNPYMEF